MSKILILSNNIWHINWQEIPNATHITDKLWTIRDVVNDVLDGHRPFNEQID